MLCRLCLNPWTEENMVALFNNGEESNLTKLIAKYTYLEVTQNDTISTKICKDCLQHLNAFHKFFQYVEERQNVLRNEFLEVKCAYNQSPLEVKDDDSEVNLEHNEEIFIKDIFEEGEGLLPQDEFEFAYSDNSNFSAEQDEDEIPLNSLLQKAEKTKTAQNKKQRKCSGLSMDEKPQRLKKTTRKRRTKLAPRKAKLTKVKQEPAEVQDENTNGAEMAEKRPKKVYSPEENKSRDDLIAKHIRLKCDICGVDANSLGDLRSHFRKVHNMKAYVTCCGKRFRRRFVLLDHIQFHLNPEHFKCTICNKVLKSRVCLDIHNANMHTDKEELKHACKLCDRRFAHVSNLSAHMISHTKERKHICEICKKAFKSAYMLKVHIRALHEQRTPYICDICGREYKFKPSFERHVAEHKGRPNEPTDQCPICLKWLMPNGLRRHMDRHNLEDVECKICGKIVKSKAALTGHILYSHKKQQNYSCTYCSKTFKRPCVLKEHIAMHTGAKEHNCPHCPREFRSKANMYAHIKKMHVLEWQQAQLARNKGPSKKPEKQE